jgi:ubiquinone/menaquinone biosynthesis C-methylase UbiE
MIDRYGIDGLLQSAEDYFQSISDYSPLLKKPFHDTREGPYLLCKTGLLLSGLRLGKGMRVLDFGAGSCWLSRFLNELHCITLSVDPSATALKIGRELFDRMPPLTRPVEPPRFLEFNGREIPLDDNHVDRIISLDAFHHVPNTHDLLAEFFRVLTPGGIIGFAEVGAGHSRSPQSQREMRTFRILENDIVIESLWKSARDLGFSEIYFKTFSHPDMAIGFDDYIRISRKKKIPRKVRDHVIDSTCETPIFFLIKGDYQPDSRSLEGLSHRLSVAPVRLKIPAQTSFNVSMTIKNTGTSRWLVQSPGNIGSVFIGAHLCDSQGKIIDHDYFRCELEKDYQPGETGEQEISLSIPEKGRFELIFDLVSEQVCWFETLGSKPVSLNVISG